MTERENNKSVEKEKSSKEKILIAAATVLVLCVAIFAVMKVYNSPARQLEKQLDLGNRYLEEMDYEQAIVAFDKAIEINPKNVDAYLGKADAYIGLGNSAMAVETLETGYHATGKDETIKNHLLDFYVEMAERAIGTGSYEEGMKAYERIVELNGDEEELWEKLEELQDDKRKETDIVQAGGQEGEELPYYELGFSPEDFTLAGYSVMDGDHLEDIKQIAAETMPAYFDLWNGGEHLNKWAWAETDEWLGIAYYPLDVYSVNYYTADNNTSLSISTIYQGFLENQNTDFPLYEGQVTPDRSSFEDAIDILGIREVVRKTKEEEKIVKYDDVEIYDEELDDYVIVNDFPVEQSSVFVFNSQYGYTECMEIITNYGDFDSYSYKIVTEEWEFNLQVTSVVYH